MSGEIWKTVPMYSRYEASSNGVIRRKRKKRILPTYENKTSKGTYKTVSLVDDHGKRRTQFVHRLTCLAFHGVPPEYPKIDTNHKDGDKHNNREDNLEWLTRSKNVKHAYETGLNKHSVKIGMLDQQTGEVKQFLSYIEVERFFGLKKSEGRNLVRNHKERPYLDRFVFDTAIDYNSAVFDHNVPLTVIDLVSKISYTSRTINEMAQITGLGPTSLSKCVRSGPTGLLRGCFVFRRDHPTWQEELRAITTEDIELSVASYGKFGSVRLKKNTEGYKVRNYASGEDLVFKKKKEIAEYIAVGVGTIGSYIDRGQTTLLKGVVIKRKEDTTPFPEYSKELATLSLTHSVSNGVVVEVTDLTSNTTKLFSSIAAFAKSIGEKPEPFRQRWKTGTVKQYKIEYLSV